MKLQPHLKLRRIGKACMIVDSQSGTANLTNVYELNETAAAVWEYASAGSFTAETLAKALTAEFEIDFAAALHDVEELLNTWQQYGLILHE